MERSITAAALILVAACGTPRASWKRLPTDGPLSYAQLNSLEKGRGATTILKAFGEPKHKLNKDGRIRGLTYPCEDGTGNVQELRMVFSAKERLTKWTLGKPSAAKS